LNGPGGNPSSNPPPATDPAEILSQREQRILRDLFSTSARMASISTLGFACNAKIALVDDAQLLEALQFGVVE